MSQDNSGRLSKNERKEKDSHPDLKGSATINGVEYWISGWSKTNDRGKWLSLSFQPKDDPQERRAIQSEPRRQSAPKDDLPW